MVVPRMCTGGKSHPSARCNTKACGHLEEGRPRDKHAVYLIGGTNSTYRTNRGLGESFTKALWVCLPFSHSRPTGGRVRNTVLCRR